jgi:prepilin-type N-terminal cleavage/methylation domain-containing protein
MKMAKKTSGFTLIETLVVAAIVAVLAAVSIPMYIGYVNNQRQTTVNNLAETAAAAANAYVRRTGQCPTVAQLNLYYNAAKYTVNAPVCNLPNGSVTVFETAKPSITATTNF